MPSLSLRTNFFWTLVGNVVYAACQWGMFIVLSKLGSPDMVGQLALGFAITAPVMMLTNLQLRAVQATDAKEEYEFADYLGLRLSSTGLALLIIIGIAGFSAYQQETVGVILCVGLAKAFETISDICYGFLQRHERMDLIARSMIIRGVLSVITFGLLLVLTNRLLWGVIGLALVWASVLSTYDLANAAFVLSHQTHPPQRIAPRWNKATLYKLFRLSLPLGFVMMLLSLNTNIPRYFITHYWGERTLGIFAAMAYLFIAGTTVVSALGQSTSPRLARYYAQQNFQAFWRLLLKLFGVGGILGIFGILVAGLAGKDILTLLYNSEYARQDILVLLMTAAGFNYLSSFAGYGMTAARYFTVQLPLFLCVVMTTLLFSFYLIPTKGLSGAAMALICSSGIQLLISIVVLGYALRALQGHLQRHDS